MLALGILKISANFAGNLLINRLTVAQFRNLPVPESFARSPGDVDTTPPEGFLYQSGYQTLRERKTGKFLLDYPNTEVLNSMSRLLIQNIVTETVYNVIHDELTTSGCGNKNRH